MPVFIDHFSARAASYAEFRPSYPDALFAWLAASTAGHDLAWDCATGNGQAALGLAVHYAHVIATDASTRQLEHAAAHPRVEYLQRAADEASGLPGGAVDLVTVAQALHWLPLASFYEEVRRVLAVGGLFAVWGYSLPSVFSSRLDAELRRFHDEVVGPWWSPERRMVVARYQNVPFPFEEVNVPAFALEQRWSRRRLEGYVGTWSATTRYRAARDDDPWEQIAPAFEAEWPDPDEVRLVRWPLFMRAGRPDRM